jgi:hypothetical protein
MRDGWYFAKANEPIGPVSIEELKRTLHRLKDWKEGLVWHSSFNEWRKAGAVRELAVRADLLWDDEVHGLCLRIYGDGSKSFIFIYCFDGHQKFIRIGRSPEWSLEAARVRAQELRSIVDQGHDPRLSEYCQRSEISPVAGLTRYGAAHTQTIQMSRRQAVGPNQWAAKRPSKDEARFIAPNVVTLIFAKRRSAKMR